MEKMARSLAPRALEPAVNTETRGAELELIHGTTTGGEPAGILKAP